VTALRATEVAEEEAMTVEDVEAEGGNRALAPYPYEYLGRKIFSNGRMQY
jgi:hypothetical protein